MGNYISIITEFENELKYLREKNTFLEDRLEKMYERVGRLEKDIINTSIKANLIKEDVKHVKNRVLNIDLLEEGRSYIGSRKRHTHSMYSK